MQVESTRAGWAAGTRSVYSNVGYCLLGDMLERRTRERYDDAVRQFQAAARQAVREVEQALVRLDSTARRSADAVVAVQGYAAFFAGIEARYRGGLASLLELEEARRVRLTAETALLSLQNERTAAWITLYRAAGGGWDGVLEQQARVDNSRGASEKP